MLLDTESLTALAEAAASSDDELTFERHHTRQLGAALLLALANAEHDAAELRNARHEIAQLRQRCETQQAEIDNNARRNAWAAVDEDEAPAGFWSGPTPANERFVSAMACGADDAEIADAIAQAEWEERERLYQDCNETLGIQQGSY